MRNTRDYITLKSETIEELLIIYNIIIKYMNYLNDHVVCNKMDWSHNGIMLNDIMLVRFFWVENFVLEWLVYSLGLGYTLE